MKSVPMPGPKFTKTERMQVLNEVGKLDRRGLGQFAIAERVGVSRRMVGKYLRNIRKRYALATIDDRTALVNEKSIQYADVRSVAWAAWEKSVEEGKPEPRYLDIICKCLHDECKARGLHETNIKFDMTQKIDWDLFLAPFRKGGSSNVIDQEVIETTAAITDESTNQPTTHPEGTNGLNGKHHVD